MAIGFRCVCSIRSGPNGEVDHLKAWLVAKNISISMGLNIVILSFQWPKWILLDFSLVWQPFVIDLFIN